MKYITFFILVFSISCSNSNTSSNEQEKKDITEFKSFLENFQEKSLPFSIKNNKDFFPRLAYDSVKNAYTKSTYHSVEPGYYKFINSSIPNNNEEYDNRYGFKLFQNKGLTVLITFKDSLWSDVYSMVNCIVLNTYKDHHFVNSIVFAGSTANDNTIFGRVDVDLNTEITTYQVLPSTSDTEGIFVREIIRKYNISNTGEIVLLKTDEKKGFYTFENGEFKSLQSPPEIYDTN